MWSANRKPKLSWRGFSLFEFLLAISLFFVIALAAIPRAAQWRASFNRNNAVNQVESDLRRAQSEAISEGVRGIITINPDGHNYSFGFDNPPYNEPPTADRTLFVRTLPEEITVLSHSGTRFFFDSRGFVTDSAGNPETLKFQLNWKGVAFASLTVYAIGYVERS